MGKTPHMYYVGLVTYGAATANEKMQKLGA
jgi:hypothetical protein